MAIRLLLLLHILTKFFLHVPADPTYISMPLTSEGVGIHSRHLLQALTQCSVNFEVQNYTIITSVCKGPDYPEKQCCGAFLKFACPFAAQINDNTTDCANIMFNYINVYGQYPAGLFANECHGDAQGLPCPASDTNTSLASTQNSNARLNVSYHRVLWWIVIIFSSLVLFGAELVN